eukprot:7125021-Ditylum_brightwellii.AAC.1
MLSRCVKLFKTPVKGKEFTIKLFVKDRIDDSVAVTFADEVRSGVKYILTIVSNHQKMIDSNVEAVLITKKRKKRKARTPPTKYGANGITVEYHLDTGDTYYNIFEGEEVNRKEDIFGEKGLKAIDDFN